MTVNGGVGAGWVPPVPPRAIALAGFVMACACGGASPQAPGPAMPPSPTISGLASRSLSFQGQGYPYVVFSPPSAGARSVPALFLAHGFGGNGPDFLTLWQSFAASHGILLVAPTLPLGGNFESRAPALFAALGDAVKREWSVDPARTYVFGYSAGGYVAFDVGLLDSTSFAAAGVFAAVITPDFDWIVSGSPRRTAIALYMGDRDQFFTLDQSRRTRDVLLANGIDLHYVELANHDHDYASVAASVNEDAWQFLSAHTLIR